ncbi:bifunctional phosphopantothenoylcysteine decarboxylase/phosphopantothenate--cysteine ligase CoaBC [Hoyosella rhizosphaerae]|uniref:bifunctional phosphopantothenoylcysteine decarboxylase/phosphopantothenate--cysteine ligase CoaBC n=1 Tax=Hoyosella rhizosphaerae TaxID=1755582 RepID=UPI0016662977|nr:bifunctional phosphopantothenoylcysteine decarboxylase/phosphopantothenate--cysteine ligase CoaBC [Hoyosella rhizosphaerae]MBN4926463.1 bifunctional phosphopantothenoylcysteine decarboxylase/phosphopantothenate--cysteine ligase CoaBC [Hoyosella rhizosphaerae]
METPAKRIVIGVAGGIAAYKSCALIRYFTERGHSVRVVPTASALEFIGKATFEALSGNPVDTGVFEKVPEVQHVKLGQQADLVIVAPATADVMARAAHGRADDLLTATLLTARCPVLFAPAMHTEMWDHPATVDNVATLRARGVVVMEPASGRLTGHDSGPGRLPDADEIGGLGAMLLERRDSLPRDLTGCTLVVTAGGTREPLDPVRFLGNRSSGKQGFALARLAVQRGASVTVVAGATAELPVPAGVRVVNVTTAEQMRKAVHQLSERADIVIMAAAVADFRPVSVAESKIKKGNDEPTSIPLVKNPDILAEVVKRRDQGELPVTRVIVGFAAETGDEQGDVLTHARSKLNRKRCDLLVVNAVGEGKAFEVDSNMGWLLKADGTESALPLSSKNLMASRILDAVSSVLHTS